MFFGKAEVYYYVTLDDDQSIVRSLALSKTH